MNCYTLLLIIALLLCSLQPSFAAFPVKRAAVTNTRATAISRVHTGDHKQEKISAFRNWIAERAILLHDLRHPYEHEGTCGTLAFVFGILGCMGAFPLAVAAIILGIIGQQRHEEHAHAGLILGIVGVCLVLLIITLVVVVFKF